VTTAGQALASIPAGLREPLLDEYRSIVQNYLERRWSPSELSGGKFCEIVFTILDGYAIGRYAAGPFKPANFVMSCRALEGNSHVLRSFQILIPRLLPALYEIRNNRGVGHIGGDVDPNHMDAIAVLSMANWVMAELVRVLHGLTVDEAQVLVDGLAERRVPLVWQGQSAKRVLDPDLSLKDQLLLLINSAPTAVSTADLLSWSGYKSKPYFLRLLRQMHAQRLVELSGDETAVHTLPPGSLHVENLIATRVQSAG
jgi:hypothetical protein